MEKANAQNNAVGLQWKRLKQETLQSDRNAVKDRE
jgi:hypothetical protein